MEKFNGFTRATLDFLVDLGKNNNRAWMEASRERYREVLLDPFKALVNELGPFMEELDPFLETRPQVGKTISRISRDARRNRGRAPYRTNMWLTFKVPSPTGRTHRASSSSYSPTATVTDGLLFPIARDHEKADFELEENTGPFWRRRRFSVRPFLDHGREVQRPRKGRRTRRTARLVPDERLLHLRGEAWTKRSFLANLPTFSGANSRR